MRAVSSRAPVSKPRLTMRVDVGQPKGNLATEDADEMAEHDVARCGGGQPRPLEDEERRRSERRHQQRSLHGGGHAGEHADRDGGADAAEDPVHHPPAVAPGQTR
jgi:hypothetical protein